MTAMRTTLYTLFLLVAALTTSCRNEPDLQTRFETTMRLQKCSYLTTLEGKVSKIIKADDKATWYKFGDRKILFECKGRFKAGIDLSNSNYKAEINEKEKKIKLTLPKANIKDIYLSPEDTKLVYEKVSLTRFNFEPQERVELLRQGEQAIRKEIAEDKEIISKAEENADEIFYALLNEIGFESVTITHE